ncbi:hypothetical protein [Hymenobacter sp. B1770]|uniref:hypothetical protein n=1 Tax=Hymenobacter sp. B1770 TaxID=1718788 RepID=UPI003CE76ED4
MINDPAGSEDGAVTPSLRVVGYVLSTLVALYLWLLCSPYKLQYGPIAHQYYNDDGIFFGLVTSVLLLLVHGARAFGMLVVYRKKPSSLTLAFMLFYFLTACYWVYHVISNGAMHEY